MQISLKHAKVLQSIMINCAMYLLGPHPNTCFACSGKGLSSGTLVIRTETLTQMHDC